MGSVGAVLHIGCCYKDDIGVLRCEAGERKYDALSTHTSRRWKHAHNIAPALPDVCRRKASGCHCLYGSCAMVRQ
jgi:hypothetical protein